MLDCPVTCWFVFWSSVWAIWRSSVWGRTKYSRAAVCSGHGRLLFPVQRGVPLRKRWGHWAAKLGQFWGLNTLRMHLLDWQIFAFITSTYVHPWDCPNVVQDAEWTRVWKPITLMYVSMFFFVQDVFAPEAFPSSGRDSSRRGWHKPSYFRSDKIE